MKRAKTLFNKDTTYKPTTRQHIVEAARRFGTLNNGLPCPDRTSLGDGAMIAEMEWGYWVGVRTYVSKENVRKVANNA